MVRSCARVRRQPIHRDEAAPGDAAGECRLAGAEQAGAHLRVDAVGRDDGAGTDLVTARELRGRRLGGLRHRLAAHAELDGVRLQLADRLDQNAMQIVAMHENVRRTEALHRSRTERQPVPRFAGAPMPQLPSRRHHLHLPQRLLKSERVKHARAVRTDLHAGADLAQHGRLFVDDDVEPALQQRKCGRQPADAAADDSNGRGRFRHAPPLHASAKSSQVVPLIRA